MKIEDGYMLKEIAGNYVVIPVGQNIVYCKSILHLNETGAFIWKEIETGKNYNNIMEDLLNEYDAAEEDKDIIKHDLDEFIEQMNLMHLIKYN